MHKQIKSWIESMFIEKYHEYFEIEENCEYEISNDEKEIFSGLFDLISHFHFNYNISLNIDKLNYNVYDYFHFMETYYIIKFQIIDSKNNIIKWFEYKIRNDKLYIHNHFKNNRYQYKLYGSFIIKTILNPSSLKFKAMIEYLKILISSYNTNLEIVKKTIFPMHKWYILILESLIYIEYMNIRDQKLQDNMIYK